MDLCHKNAACYYKFTSERNVPQIQKFMKQSTAEFLLGVAVALATQSVMRAADDQFRGWVWEGGTVNHSPIVGQTYR
jgi:hypothetical protein